MPTSDIDLIEPLEISDIFASALARVEMLTGGVVRFWLTSEVHRADGATEQIVVARVVMPIDAVPAGIKLAMRAINERQTQDAAAPARMLS